MKITIYKKRSRYCRDPVKMIKKLEYRTISETDMFIEIEIKKSELNKLSETEKKIII